MNVSDKALSDLKNCRDIQCSDGNWNYSEYMWGMANGLILAIANIDGKDPEYLDKPDQWLEDKPENVAAVAALS